VQCDVNVKDGLAWHGSDCNEAQQAVFGAYTRALPRKT